jgi:hypothetical protein
MEVRELIFRMAQSQQEVEDIYNFNVNAFADAQDFDWSIDNIKKELKDNWKLYSVSFDKDIIAALFIKIDGDALFTKNTPIKMPYQGNGFSHKIKEFYEDEALNLGLNKVVNLCTADNFRMISLNEGHNYQRTGRTFGKNNEIIEWEKKLTH